MCRAGVARGGWKEPAGRSVRTRHEGGPSSPQRPGSRPGSMPPTRAASCPSIRQGRRRRSTVTGPIRIWSPLRKPVGAVSRASFRIVPFLLPRSVRSAGRCCRRDASTGGSSSATPIPTSISDGGCMWLARRAPPPSSATSSAPSRQRSRVASCAGSSSTPTSVSPSATAARREWKRPSATSGPTATPSSSCSIRRRTSAPICAGRRPFPASTRCCRTSASTSTPSSG